MTAAIYYLPEAYTTSGPKLTGRNAAGETFLRGFLLHSKATEFWAQVQKLEHARLFAQTAQTIGRTEPMKAVDMNGLGALAQVGVVHYPGPGIGEHAYHRSAFGNGAWSLCGNTHTTSSAGAMAALTDLSTAPVQFWDALICTSAAVKDNVTRLLRAQVDYLHTRLGISRVVLPKLPVIPLGIHTGYPLSSTNWCIVAVWISIPYHQLLERTIRALGTNSKVGLQLSRIVQTIWQVYGGPVGLSVPLVNT